MAEGNIGGKAGAFLKGSTAGLPNWAWITVVAVGVAAAYFLPKLLGANSSTASTTPTTGTDTTSGIGLAVDPTTGLPYAVSGLVPSGAYAGSGTGSIGQTGPTGPIGPAGTPGSQPFQELPQGTLIYQQGSQYYYETPNSTKPQLLLGGAGSYLPENAKLAKGGDGRWWANIGGIGYALEPTYGSQVAPSATGSFITVPSWPSPQMTLDALAAKLGISKARLQQLNPGIGGTLKTGEKVKVA
jgi:hypothetical protein